MTDLSYLETALLVDNHGNATQQHELIRSTDFDAIRLWSDKVYMPYRVDPVGRNIQPNSSLHALTIGSMTISRFSYGIPVRVHDFALEADAGIVLTTIKGCARHLQSARAKVDTRAGESFVVDNSQVEYAAEFNPDHLQLNVTFSHGYLETLFRKLTGRVAPASFWQQKVKFGPTSISWICLLEYSIRAMTGRSNQLLENHLEEALGTNLLMQWAAASGLDLDQCGNSVAPGYVIKAEKYLRDHALEAPTLSETAAAVGISSRALHKGFKQYRNITPMKYLRELRLTGVRTELRQAPSHITVAEIAYGWGFSCLGRFAHAYRQQFGELPSETRQRRVHDHQSVKPAALHIDPAHPD